jgi:hypothetical protein
VQNFIAGKKIFSSKGLYKGRPKNLQPPKETIKSLYFFLFLWVFLPCRIQPTRISADPDPQHRTRNFQNMENYDPFEAGENDKTV